MLLDDEKNLILEYFTSGPAIFAEVGYSDEQRVNFLQRPDVVAALSLLRQEHEASLVLDSRLQFVGKRSLSRLLQPAVAVMTQALIGPEYHTDKDGKIVNDPQGNPLLVNPELTRTQFNAAQDVMNRLGVSHSDRFRPIMTANAKADTLFKERDSDDVALVESGERNQTTEERSLSHERVRNLIELLSSRVVDASANGRKPAKKKAKRKVCKKAKRKVGKTVKKKKKKGKR